LPSSMPRTYCGPALSSRCRRNASAGLSHMQAEHVVKFASVVARHHQTSGKRLLRVRSDCRPAAVTGPPPRPLHPVLGAAGHQSPRRALPNLAMIALVRIQRVVAPSNAKDRAIRPMYEAHGLGPPRLSGFDRCRSRQSHDLLPTICSVIRACPQARSHSFHKASARHWSCRTDSSCWSRFQRRLAVVNG